QIADPSVLMLLRLTRNSGLGFALCGFWTPTHQSLLASDTESAGDRLGEGVHMDKGEVMAVRTVGSFQSIASACSSQYVMPISRYIVVAVARCSCACSRLPVRRYSLPRPRWRVGDGGRMSRCPASTSASR